MFLLINNGNDCYLNFKIKKLLNKYQIIFFFTLNIDVKNHNEIYKVFKNLLANNTLFNSSIIKNSIRNFDIESKELFNNQNQQDAHEAIVKLIDIIHKISMYSVPLINDKIEKLRLLITNQEERISFIQIRENSKIFGYSFVSEYFTGQFKSLVSCKCGYKNVSYDLFNNVNLQIAGEDISDCFQDFIKTERIKDAKCEKCQLKKMTKNNSIWRFPAFLIVNLKRYIISERGISKNNSILELTENIYFQNSSKLHNYSLISVVNHHGSSPSRGHYTSDILKNGQWYNIDDDAFKKITFEELNKRNSYILIYRLND